MLDVLDGIYNKDKTSRDIVLGPFFKLFLYNALLLCINKYTKVPMSKYLNVSKTLTLASMIGLILSVLIAKFIRSAFTEKKYIYSDIYEILKYLYASYFELGLAFIFLSLIINYVMTFHFFIIYVGLTMLLAITTILYLAYRLENKKPRENL